MSTGNTSENVSRNVATLPKPGNCSNFFIFSSRYIRFQGYTRLMVRSKKTLIISIIIIPPYSHPLFTVLILFPNQTTAPRRWTSMNSRLPTGVCRKSKTTKSNQNWKQSGKTLLHSTDTLLISGCFFIENLRQTWNSTVLNWSKYMLLHKVLDFPSSPDASVHLTLPLHLPSKWQQESIWQKLGGGRVAAQIKGILDGDGNMRSSLFGSNPHLCHFKKKNHHRTKGIILVPHFTKTDKPSCKLAAQIWCEGTRFPQRANAPIGSLCQTVTMCHQGSWFPLLMWKKTNPEKSERFPLNR